MRSRSSPAVLAWVLSLAAALPSVLCAAPPPDEPALLGLFQQHQREGARPDALRDACLQFEQRHGSSALLPVARGLLAWDQLRLQATNEAAKALTAMASGPGGVALQAAALEISRAWLTRIDRERVRSALKAYYAAHADFPSSVDGLKSLPEALRPPAADRWGRSWKYAITSFERVKGLKMQRYTVESPSLPPGRSDLAVALMQPYGSASPLKPVRIESAGGARTVVFDVGGRKEILSEGARQGGTVLAFAGVAVLVLADGEYWAVLPAPAGEP